MVETELLQDWKPRFGRLLIGLVLTALALCPRPVAAATPAATVGAYYFEGWYHDTPEAIAAFATAELRNDFPQREPIWGGGLWRGDTVEVMEQQIDLAADHGITFFSFDWYWNGSAAATVNDGINSGLKNFMLASNRDRMRFNINIVDAGPTTIDTDAQWRQVADLLIPYLADSRYLRVGGNPLVTNFNAPGMTQANYDYFQQAAAAAGINEVEFAANVGGDASIYSHVTRYNAVPGWGAGETEFPYQSLTEYVEGNDSWAPGIWNTESGGPQSYIPTIMAGWDARPWNTPPSWFFNPTRTPEAVGAHLQKAIDWIDANPALATSKRLVMIYAWNEFGEGGYIVPTLGDPDGLYLDAIKAVVLGADQGTPCTGPQCKTLDAFTAGSFDLVQRDTQLSASPLVHQTPLSSTYFTNGRRVTEVRLDAGNMIRVRLNTSAPTLGDDTLRITLDRNSSGSATVAYAGDGLANLTAGGHNGFEVILDTAPNAGTLFAYAEDVRTWDYAEVPVTGPGTYTFAFSDMNALSHDLDFSRLSILGFGIRAAAGNTKLIYDISAIRVVALGAGQSTVLPEPGTLALMVFGCLLLSRRRCGGSKGAVRRR